MWFPQWDPGMNSYVRVNSYPNGFLCLHSKFLSLNKIWVKIHLYKSNNLLVTIDKEQTKEFAQNSAISGKGDVPC